MTLDHPEPNSNPLARLGHMQQRVLRLSHKLAGLTPMLPHQGVLLEVARRLMSDPALQLSQLLRPLCAGVTAGKGQPAPQDSAAGSPFPHQSLGSLPARSSRSALDQAPHLSAEGPEGSGTFSPEPKFSSLQPTTGAGANDSRLLHAPRVAQANAVRLGPSPGPLPGSSSPATALTVSPKREAGRVSEDIAARSGLASATLLTPALSQALHALTTLHRPPSAGVGTHPRPQSVFPERPESEPGDVSPHSSSPRRGATLSQAQLQTGGSVEDRLDQATLAGLTAPSITPVSQSQAEDQNGLSAERSTLPSPNGLRLVQGAPHLAALLQANIASEPARSQPSASLPATTMTSRAARPIQPDQIQTGQPPVGQRQANDVPSQFVANQGHTPINEQIDMEELLEQLAERLEFEFIRTYGTSGRSS